MYDGLERNGWQADKVRDWLLAIVQFAITLEPGRPADGACDRAGDGRARFSAGPLRPSAISSRTSTGLCRAIADRDDPGRTAILRRHLAAIVDRRSQTDDGRGDRSRRRPAGAPVRGAMRGPQRAVEGRGAGRRGTGKDVTLIAQELDVHQRQGPGVAPPWLGPKPSGPPEQSARLARLDAHPVEARIRSLPDGSIGAKREASW